MYRLSIKELERESDDILSDSKSELDPDIDLDLTNQFHLSGDQDLPHPPDPRPGPSNSGFRSLLDVILDLGEKKQQLDSGWIQMDEYSLSQPVNQSFVPHTTVSDNVNNEADRFS